MKKERVNDQINPVGLTCALDLPLKGGNLMIPCMTTENTQEYSSYEWNL